MKKKATVKKIKKADLKKIKGGAAVGSLVNKVHTKKEGHWYK